MEIDTVLIVSLIAAVVSLITLVANLHIARKTRIANDFQLKLAATIRDCEESINGLREYSKDIELFRVQCWILSSKLKLSRNDEERAKEQYSKYLKEYESFMMSWADVKADLKIDLTDYNMRMLVAFRHEIRREAEALNYLIEKCFSKINKRDNILSSGASVGRNDLQALESQKQLLMKDINDQLRSLLEMLDSLFSNINSINMKKIEKLFEGEKA